MFGIRFHGRGRQRVKTASQVLGTALILARKAVRVEPLIRIKG